MRLFGLIGNPLTHSFSAKYFSEKFQREGRSDCRYELFPLKEIKDLPALLETHPALEGLNVTIPYKREVLSFLHNRPGIPAGLDACNCIRIRKGQLSGFNTDIAGFRNSLKPLLQPQHQKALVLGNGGATAAVVFVLKELGIQYDIVSRQLHGTSGLSYKELNETIIKSHTLIINTTPLGMFPALETCPDIPYRFAGQDHLFYDLVYNPAKTLFLQKAELLGARIKNGEEMLEIQAAESWRIWNGD